ncbi:Ras GTPase activating protein ira2 [Tieghemiomyces parasiticus]|uniref:Ras GTPase activating protein ira2 n=1 Tax=Tieghemiomyces parasiticus TaxID=78921 RepID=A0A9W8DXB4_9FUNG|nr:Ras GTPase activating protein ira2 [Tieghemiomyces parasiticus]
MDGDTLLILALINKLSFLLPCYTNKSYELLESDEVLKSIVRSLLEISEYRLNITAQTIIKLIESISRTANNTSSEETQLNVTYSQNFLTRILVGCMAYNWHKTLKRAQADGRGFPSNQGTALPYLPFCDPSLSTATRDGTGSTATVEDEVAINARRFSKSLGRSPLQRDPAYASQLMGNSKSTYYEVLEDDPTDRSGGVALVGKELYVGNFHGTFTRPVVFTPQNINAAYVTEQILMDPVPFDEPLAKYVFNAVLRIILSHPAPANHDLASIVANLDQSRAFYLSTARSYLFLTGSYASTFVPNVDSFTNLVFTAPRREARVSQALIANRILFYLSASNWPVVFARIKARMMILASSQEELPDVQEIRILEYCHLNTTRLAQVLQELSVLFLQFRRNVQLTVAPTLRRMIWNWIESYPADYIALWKEGRRLDGNPEILFDVCLSLHDNAHPKGKLILWPLQATLLALCPDVVNVLANFEGGSKAAKRRVFLDHLAKAMRNSRNFEAAAHAYVDLIRAAAYVGTIPNTPLSAVVGDFEPSLRERLFDFRASHLDVTNAADQRFLMEALITYHRYDPTLAVRHLVPLFLQEGIAVPYRLILVKACYTLAIEPTLPWLPNISTLYATVASPFRKMLQTFINQPAGEQVPRKSSLTLERALLKRGSSKASDLDALKAERIEVIVTLLKLYWTDPLPAIFSVVPDVQFAENLTLFANVTACFREPVTTIRSMAAFTVLALHEPVYVESWGPPGSLMPSFWTISSQVLLAVAREILDFNDREEGAKFMLYVLLRLLMKRNQVLQRHPGQVAAGIEVHDRLVASVAMEIALLVLLCSAEPGIITMAQDCFALLCDEAALTEETEDPAQSNFTVVKNYAVYRELAAGTTMIAGKVAQQKRIRRLLRQMTVPTMGNLAAWEEAYKRWRALIHGVTRGLDGDDDSIHGPGSGETGGKLGSSLSATNLHAKESAPVPPGPVEKIKKKTPFHQKLSISHNRHHHSDGGKDHAKDTAASHHANTSATGSGSGSGVALSSHPSASTLIGGGAGSFSKGSHLHHLSAASATSSFEESIPRAEDRGEWQNYTGFLCALGGVCLQGSGVDAGGPSPMAAPTTSGVDPPQMLHRFMQELVDLLVCDNVLVRETIKDILGSDLSPALFALLLSHLQRVVNRFVTPEGDIQCTDHCTLFVGQAISVVKMILERMHEPTVSLFTVDLGGLVYSFARYLQRLGSGPLALQIKIRMCQLSEVLMQKKDYVSLRQEIKFRNKLLDLVISWTSDFSGKSSDVHHHHHHQPSGSVGGVNAAGSGNNAGGGSGGPTGSGKGAHAAPDGAGHLPNEDSAAYHQNEKLHRDLDQECMRTIVSLLLGLPLQPQENVPEAELRVVKSHQFFRYFSFFIKLLNRCRVLEIIETGSHRSKLTQDLQNLLSKSKEYVKDLGPLKEYTILALSNLLSANIESGLKYSLSMGYHEDSKIRTSFMQVLTNILNQGTEFDGLAESSLAEKQAKLLDLVVEPGLAVALALCDACPVSDVDELASVLLAVFDTRGLTMPLLKAVTERELSKTDSAPEMFRRNCIATRLLSVFGKFFGSEYLRETLQCALQAIIARAAEAGPGFSFELDPTKLSAGSSPQHNLHNLRDLCSTLLDAIVRSSPRVPAAFRDFCHFLVSVVGARFPGAEPTAVGGFVFLRFFCPAIVAPDTHGLVTGMVSKDVRRGLILATKVIQSLANDVLFGTKEAFMTPMNEFLIAHKRRVAQYVAALSEPLATPATEASEPAKRPVDPSDVARLHKFVADNLERIGRDLVSIKPGKPAALLPPAARTAHEPTIPTPATPAADRSFSLSATAPPDTAAVRPRDSMVGGDSTETVTATLARVSLDQTELGHIGASRPNSTAVEPFPSLPAVAGANGNPSTELDRLTQSRKQYDLLCTLLSQLGKPPEVGTGELVLAAVKGGASTELYREFMQRNAHRGTDPIKLKKLFYEGGPSKEKRPVVYFIARRLIADATDMDLLMLHVFQTLEPLMKKPFELLMDLTQFGHANEVQSQWINQFLQLLPEPLVQNLHTVYMYNVNSSFKHYTKRLLSTVPLKLTKRIVFPFNLNDLYAHINPADLDLPKGTVSLETDNGVNISPVSRVYHMKAPMPTIIKITNEAIQITSLKKQEIVGMSSYFNDVYHISEVDDVAMVTSPRHDETLVVVKFDRGNSSMTFSSPKHELIYKAIRSTRARFQMSKPATLSERLIRPNDVPGTLLNMALLNSGSDDPNLRLAAYNLLYALSLNFNFDVGNLLFNAAGLCIPANNTNFIISISHKIAACEPRFTLEFLSECFVGFGKSSTPLKHLCLEYMAPWLPNLALFCRRGADHAAGHHRLSLTKTVEVIKVLVELTVKESEMYPSIQAKIWRKIGRAEELLDVVLNFFVQYAVECGPFSAQAEVLANTIVTLAAVNVRTAKLISRLRKLLVRTSVSPARTLLEHPSWSEIAVLIRFSLMLMYNNPAAAQQYLPEIFFNLTMVIGIGPASIRTSVHGLVINVIQSLVASVAMDKADLKDLNSLVAQFSEPRFRLMFGLHRVSGNAAAVHGGNGADVEMPDATSLVALETIIQSLLGVVDCRTFAADVANAWRARWMSLVTSTAFQYNLAIQPRAFVMLGCLASDEVDDDLLYQVLVTLRGALAAFDDKDTNLIQSIVLCLTKLVNKLPIDSQFLPSLFWLAVAVLQIGHVHLFISGLALLEETLRALDTQGFLVDTMPYEFLLATRQPFEDTMAAIDGTTGVNFHTDFSFALATLLLKGLHHPNSKGAVLNLLHTFIGVHTARGAAPGTATKRVSAQVLGAVVPLLPVSAKNGELAELMWHLGLGDLRLENLPVQHCYHRILDRFESPTDTSAVLLASFLVVMLNMTQYEGEQLFLYGFLSEVAVTFPETFALVYHSLLPKMNAALASSQHLPTLEAIQSILISVVGLRKRIGKVTGSSLAGSGSGSTGAPKSSATSIHSGGMSIKSDSSAGRLSHEEKLHELGFAGLIDATTFENILPATMRRNAALASTLVDRIVS